MARYSTKRPRTKLRTIEFPRYAHSRVDKRMEAQAKMIDAMGLNEETAQRFIQ